MSTALVEDTNKEPTVVENTSVLTDCKDDSIGEAAVINREEVLEGDVVDILPL